MKRFTAIQIIYVALTLSLIGGLAFTQSRGMRLLNVFSTGLGAHKDVSRPIHK